MRRVDAVNPHKGHGFFARRPIPAGTVILAESPLLPQRPGSTHENMKYLIKTALAVCPDAFNALAPRPCDDPTVKYKRNAFMFAGYPALLFNGAVFNHSCHNNVHFAPNTKRTHMIFTTTRNIESGEELCDSYTTQCASVRDAHARLKSQYGFACDYDCDSRSKEHVRDTTKSL